MDRINEAHLTINMAHSLLFTELTRYCHNHLHKPISIIMKPGIITSLLFVLSMLSLHPLQAQEEARNKLELSITYGGKTTTASLISASTSLTRYSDDYYPPATKDSATGKAKPADEKRSTFYLTMVVKKVNPDLLRAFAKRGNRFDGAITISDTYGKNPDRTIAFKGGMMESYSDQFTGADYSDSYYGTNVAITCKSITINGVEIEP